MRDFDTIRVGADNSPFVKVKHIRVVVLLLMVFVLLVTHATTAAAAAQPVEVRVNAPEYVAGGAKFDVTVDVYFSPVL